MPAALQALHGLFCELTALDMQSKEAAAAVSMNEHALLPHAQVRAAGSVHGSLASYGSCDECQQRMSDCTCLLPRHCCRRPAAAPRRASSGL